MKLTIFAKPNSKEAKVEKVDETTYKVFVKEPPVKGLANRAIVNLLADYFDVSISAIRIVSGYTSRTKIIELP
jgi:hypothetical protein